MSTAVVTGAAGFIGSHVAAAFSAAGHRVIGIDRSPHDGLPVAAHHVLTIPGPGLAEILADERPDTLVHCAGAASVPDSFTDLEGDFASTVGVTFHVLDAVRRAAPGCHVIYPSSAAVYGEPADLPVGEGDPIAPISPYGFHKRQAELLCAQFHALYGVASSILRIFSAYGPRLRRQVVWDICRMAVADQAIRLEGTGQETRDFIHVRDLADAMLALSPTPGGHRVLNVATGVATPIVDIAALIAEALGLAAPIEATGTMPDGKPSHWRADISDLRAAGYTPEIDLADGIGDTVAWAVEALREGSRADLP